jgi:acyl-CoA synthetase (AMP-forming)/AMP-acid ligase II
LWLHRGAEAAAAILGTLKAGAVVVPLDPAGSVGYFNPLTFASLPLFVQTLITLHVVGVNVETETGVLGGM